MRRIFGWALILLGLVGFLYPGCFIAYYLATDVGLRESRPSTLAFRWHRQLHQRYATYCERRIASGIAATLKVNQLEETEWPLIGSCFFLWATENLQEAWEADPSLAPEAPATYAKEAIEAATALVIDPNHAHWVRDHWGNDYLVHENAFYRMLYLSALCSHHRLTGAPTHLAAIRHVADALREDISQAPSGLLEDYPGECYPADVVAALVALKRAYAILEEDHQAWLASMETHYIGTLDRGLGLPAYFADAATGIGDDASRGCANAYLTTFSPTLWPDRANTWFQAFEDHFWQERAYGVGFREYPRGRPQGQSNLDSGPLIDGFGVAASAFGISACRANGRFDMAYPLTAELLVASWPIPFKGLLTPRLLSNPHAPLLGEASIVFQLSLLPQPKTAVVTSKPTRLPLCVLSALLLYFVGGSAMVWFGKRQLRNAKRRGWNRRASHKAIQ